MVLIKSMSIGLFQVMLYRFIKKYDPEAVSPKTLKEGGWEKIWDISKIMPH
jgi:hypothetical protein